MQLSCVFCCISPSRRIFILGPSHHVPLSRCALSSVDIYRTPLYDLRIDQKSKYIELLQLVNKVFKNRNYEFILN